MDGFTGKTAVVTGAASGIGLALARRCAAEGMRVVLADVEATPLAAAAEALTVSGAEVLAQRCDVSDPASVDALAVAQAAPAKIEQFLVVACNHGVRWLSPQPGMPHMRMILIILHAGMSR